MAREYTWNHVEKNGWQSSNFGLSMLVTQKSVLEKTLDGSTSPWSGALLVSWDSISTRNRSRTLAALTPFSRTPNNLDTSTPPGSITRRRKKLPPQEAVTWSEASVDPVGHSVRRVYRRPTLKGVGQNNVLYAWPTLCGASI